MKNLLVFATILLAMSLISCGEDDGCDSDFTGTYVGPNDCAGFVNDRVEIIITGTDGDYKVSGFYESDLEQDGCTLSFSNTILGVGNKVTFTLADSTLTATQKEAATNVTLCTFIGSR